MPPTTPANGLCSPQRSFHVTLLELAIAAVILACFGPAELGRGIVTLLLWCWCRLLPAMGMWGPWGGAVTGLAIGVFQMVLLRRQPRRPPVLGRYDLVRLSAGAMVLAGGVSVGACCCGAWWTFIIAIVVEGGFQVALWTLLVVPRGPTRPPAQA